MPSSYQNQLVQRKREDTVCYQPTVFTDMLQHTEFAAFRHSIPIFLKSVVQVTWKKLAEITNLYLL